MEQLIQISDISVFINWTIIIICFCVGKLIKEFMKKDNVENNDNGKVILTTVFVIGVILSTIIHTTLSAEVIATGLLSAFISVASHQIIKEYINNKF